MFRSQTDEQLAARWDQEPWRNVDTGERSDNGNPDGRIGTRYTFDPRPECIPQRPQRHSDDSDFESDLTEPEWREAGLPLIARPPVNPILVNLRADLGFDSTVSELANEYLDEAEGRFDNRWEDDFTPEQIDHAHKVLTRLAALS